MSFFPLPCLTLDQHGHVHEHVVQLFDGGLQLDDVCMPGLDVGQRLLGARGVHDDALGENGRVALLQHVLQLLIRRGATCRNNAGNVPQRDVAIYYIRSSLTSDLEVPLDPVLAPLPVIRLRPVVLGHHLHEFPGER